MEGENQFLSQVNLEPIHAMFMDKELIKEKSDVVKKIHSNAQEIYFEQLRSHRLTEILPKTADDDFWWLIGKNSKWRIGEINMSFKDEINNLKETFQQTKEQGAKLGEKYSEEGKKSARSMQRKGKL